MRRAYTLVELVLVLMIMGLSMLVLIRELHLALDRVAARKRGGAPRPAREGLAGGGRRRP